MRLRWIAILVAATGLGAAPPSPSASGDLAAQLDDIDRRASQIQDLAARFEQQKFTALLKKPLVSSGRVRMKGSVVRWDTEVPEPAVLYSDGSEIRMFYPRQKVVEVYPIDRRITDLAASPLPRLASLREHFDIESAERVDRAGAGGEQQGKPGGRIAMRLKPKGTFLKEHVDQVRVVLDVESACLVSVEVEDADGDRTLIRFSDVKLNVGLKDRDVALAVPAGTKVSRPLEGKKNGAG